MTCALIGLVASACGDDSASGDEEPGAGTENALCPSIDTATAPSGFPISKPPSLNALEYTGPDQLGDGRYELVGVTFEPAVVVEEVMSIVFPEATFTMTSERPGEEAMDFTGPQGFGNYSAITAVCTTVTITLDVG